MKRLLVLVFLCLCLLLMLAPVAPASHGRVPAQAQAVIAATRAARARTARYIPLASTLTGTVTAKLLRYDGTSFIAGTGRLTSGHYGEPTAVTAYATTDAAGVLTFEGMPSATAGEFAFRAAPADGDLSLGLGALTWPDAGTDLGVVRPGALRTRLVAGGPWKQYYRYAYVHCDTNGYGLVRWAETGVKRTADEQLVTSYALPGQVSYIQVYFLNDEGVEVYAPTTVSAGAEAFGSAWARQRDARRIMNPTWASGRPGSSTKLMFNNFEIGAFETIRGDDLATELPDDRTVGAWRSKGMQWQSSTVKIPLSATPGYTYLLWVFDLSGGDLRLCEPYQVCTLHRSTTTVGAGESVKLSGVVPFVGGRTKRVLLYRRTTEGGQPQSAGGFATSKGWTKIATATTDGSGKYSFPRLRPKQTAWYCVWYPKDALHWAAWTSVAKVTRR